MIADSGRLGGHFQKISKTFGQKHFVSKKSMRTLVSCVEKISNLLIHRRLPPFSTSTYQNMTYQLVFQLPDAFKPVFPPNSLSGKNLKN